MTDRAHQDAVYAFERDLQVRLHHIQRRKSGTPGHLYAIGPQPSMAEPGARFPSQHHDDGPVSGI